MGNHCFLSLNNVFYADDVLILYQSHRFLNVRNVCLRFCCLKQFDSFNEACAFCLAGKSKCQPVD